MSKRVGIQNLTFHFSAQDPAALERLRLMPEMDGEVVERAHPHTKSPKKASA